MKSSTITIEIVASVQNWIVYEYLRFYSVLRTICFLLNEVIFLKPFSINNKNYFYHLHAIGVKKLLPIVMYTGRFFFTSIAWSVDRHAIRTSGN